MKMIALPGNQSDPFRQPNRMTFPVGLLERHQAMKNAPIIIPARLPHNWHRDRGWATGSPAPFPRTGH